MVLPPQLSDQLFICLGWRGFSRCGISVTTGEVPEKLERPCEPPQHPSLFTDNQSQLETRM